MRLRFTVRMSREGRAGGMHGTHTLTYLPPPEDPEDPHRLGGLDAFRTRGFQFTLARTGHIYRIVETRFPSARRSPTPTYRNASCRPFPATSTLCEWQRGASAPSHAYHVSGAAVMSDPFGVDWSVGHLATAGEVGRCGGVATLSIQDVGNPGTFPGYGTGADQCRDH